jgi:hypothetical protein
VKLKDQQADTKSPYGQSTLTTALKAPNCGERKRPKPSLDELDKWKEKK